MAYDPATGNAVLFGGQDALGRFLSDTWLFNRRSHCTKFGACLSGFVWTQVTYPAGAAVPPGRSGAALSAFSGSVVLTGGTTRSGLDRVLLNDTWEFDTSTNTWSRQNLTGPPARTDAAIAPCYGSGLATSILFGGFNGFFSAPLNDTWVCQSRSAAVVRPEPAPDHACWSLRARHGALPGLRVSRPLRRAGVQRLDRDRRLADGYLECDV
jgi:hypothetical protein